MARAPVCGRSVRQDLVTLELDARAGVLEVGTGGDLATRCGDTYRKAYERTRKQFNAAVFERLDMKDGRLCHVQYRPPSEDVFSVPEFEYGTRVGREGFEPSKAMPTDLQSAPVVHLGTDPSTDTIVARAGPLRKAGARPALLACVRAEL